MKYTDITILKSYRYVKQRKQGDGPAMVETKNPVFLFDKKVRNLEKSSYFDENIQVIRFRQYFRENRLNMSDFANIFSKFIHTCPHLINFFRKLS